jgi:DNA-binding NarL/FixJ family response regulator
MNIAVRPPLQRAEGAPLASARAMTPHVLVIHPVPLLRRGIVAALSEADWFHEARFSDFSSVAEAATGLSGLVMGDVVIVSAPELGSLVTALGPRAGCGVAVLLLGASDATSARLFGEGRIDAVLPTESASSELVHLATMLAAGGRSAPKRPTGPRQATGIGRLSVRQLEILELMTRGLLNKQIAWELGLTEGTVKSHVSAILEKLGCSRRTQAIAAFLATSGHAPLGAESLPARA